MQQYVSANYPEAYAKLKRYNLMFKKYPIEAQFTGPDPAVLAALADSAQRLMEQLPQIRLITRDLEPQVPVMEVEYNQASARMSGLSRKDVSLSMLTATGGIPIATLFDGTHPTPIYLKQTDTDGGMIEDIENISVFSTLPDVSALADDEVIAGLAGGVVDKDLIIDRLMSTTPLTQVADGVTVKWENPVIPRYNSQRSVRVQASPAPGIETEKARQAVEDALSAIEPSHRLRAFMAGRESGIRPVDALSVPEFPAGDNTDDCHPDNAFQGLPQACDNILHDTDGSGRHSAHHDNHRQDI